MQSFLNWLRVLRANSSKSTQTRTGLRPLAGIGSVKWALKLSRPGTLVIADNVVRNGAVVDTGSLDPKVQGVRRFNELVAAEPRLNATALQTVGSKGYDGFTIALVTG